MVKYWKHVLQRKNKLKVFDFKHVMIFILILCMRRESTYFVANIFLAFEFWLEVFKSYCPGAIFGWFVLDICFEVFMFYFLLRSASHPSLRHFVECHKIIFLHFDTLTWFSLWLHPSYFILIIDLVQACFLRIFFFVNIKCF